MNKIIIVSHCVLNTCSKVQCFDDGVSLAGEEEKRQAFLKACFDKGYQIIQMPCPEFLLYGGNRWGHCRSQFDHLHFRNYCREILRPFVDQIIEYEKSGVAEVIAIVGIDGSPSCGVNLTFEGNWKGEFSTNTELEEMINNGDMIEGKGVFIEELLRLLEEEELRVPVVALPEQEELMNFLK